MAILFISLYNAIITIAILLSLFIIKYNWNRRKLYALSRKLNGPPALPIIGNGYAFSGSTYNMQRYCYSILDKYSGPVRAWLGPMLLVIIRSAEDMQTLATNAGCLDKVEIFAKTNPFSALATSPVGKWKKQRKFFQPCFNLGFLDTFVDVFDKKSIECVKEIEEQIENLNFDTEYSLRTYFYRSLCETQLKVLPKGVQLPVQINNLAEVCFQRTYTPLYLHNFLFQLFPIGKKFRKMYSEIEQTIGKMIKKKREDFSNETIREQTDNSKTVKPIIEKLLEMDKEHPDCDFKKICQFVGEFIFTGTDTTTIAACSALMLISMHPDVETKIWTELFSIFGNSNRSVTCEDLKKAKYMDWVLKESLRLFPTSVLLGRKTTADVKFETMTVPAGVSVAVCTPEMHRNPKYWKDPLTFDPDRFSPEKVAERDPFCYIPFNSGPRNCIGYQYGLRSMKTILINITRMFKLKNVKYDKVADIEINWKHFTAMPVEYGVVMEKRNWEFQL